MARARQDVCGKCGKKITGKRVVLEWGGLGSRCVKCMPEKATLANGQDWKRK